MILCHRPCQNKTEYGYCKTTYCIYPEFPHRAVGYTYTKPKTNADRIRSMTDEELAHFLSIAGCPEGQTWSEGCAIPIDCEVCWSGWLKDEGERCLK